MASEKQIAANRANAKRSTGPKTAAGKQRSSRNAYRHGLFVADSTDGVVDAQNDELAGLVAAQSTDDRWPAALELAEAQQRLWRIKTIRIERWAKIDLNDCPQSLSKDLKRLAVLDRYENWALAKQRKATKKLGHRD